MLSLALLFLVIALIAGFLGLTQIAALSADIAWLMAIVFLVLFVITMLGNALRGRPRDLI